MNCKHINRFGLVLCSAILIIVGLTDTAFAADKTAYFTPFGYIVEPYLITNVISSNYTKDAVDTVEDVRRWREENSERAFMWDNTYVGSVVITTASQITLPFYQYGMVLTCLDSSIDSLDESTFDNIVAGKNSVEASHISDYVAISNDKWSNAIDMNGQTFYEKGYTIQFRKNGTYLITVRAPGMNTSAPYDYYAPIILKVVDETAQPPVATITATPTTAQVFVNGATVGFDAYTINGNNYFKLRDVAMAISGTGKQFEISWDGAKNAINLVSNRAYTEVGGELIMGDGTAKNVFECTSTILKDGTAVNLKAYTINGNNYFKLRDLAQSFDFGVSWDGDRKCITIDTNVSYTAN